MAPVAVDTDQGKDQGGFKLHLQSTCEPPNGIEKVPPAPLLAFCFRWICFERDKPQTHRDGR